MLKYFPITAKPLPQGEQITLRGKRVIFTRITGSNSNISNASNSGGIGGFSGDSRRRMRAYLESCISDYRFIGTLTYGDHDAAPWRECKYHLKKFLESWRSRSDEGFSCFWFLEFQRRGAPHFHFFSTELFPIDNRRTADEGSEMDRSREALAKAWARATGDESQKHIAAGCQLDRIRKGRDGTLGYASKYGQKMEQKTVPDMFINQGTGKSILGRFWGISGEREVMSAAIRIIHGELKRPDQRDFRERLMVTLRSLEFEGKARSFSNDWCTIYTIDDKSLVDDWIAFIEHGNMIDVESRARRN